MSEAELSQLVPHLFVACLVRETNRFSCADEVLGVCGPGIDDPAINLTDCKDVEVAAAENPEECRDIEPSIDLGEHCLVIHDCHSNPVESSLHFLMPLGFHRRLQWIVPH